MLKKIFYETVEYFRTLNVYVTKVDDTDETRREQIKSTRIFILLFLISAVGLVGYASLNLQLTNIQIKNPSKSTFEKLYLDYSETLNCPCSQTLIQIGKFVNFSVSYYQICSSIFVTDEWISSISNRMPAKYYSLDIRRMISSQLQLLSSQCRLSQIIIQDSLNSLSLNSLFLQTIIDRKSMNSQVDIMINESKQAAITKQGQSRTLIQNLFQQNQIISALNNDFLYENIDNTSQGYYLVKYLVDSTYPPLIGFTGYSDSDLCYCIDSFDCSYPSGIYPNLTGLNSYEYYGLITPPMISQIQIPSLQVGCMPFNSILQSTLECFYNQTCLVILFNQTNIQSLNRNLTSIYSPNTEINNLIENLFIESLISEKSFDLFYNQCQPYRCSYAYNSRGNLAFVVLTFLSLIGGLFIGLKVIAQFIVYIYEQIKIKLLTNTLFTEINQNNLNGFNKISFYLRRLMKILIQQLIQLNFFEQSYSDDHSRKNEIITTRVYILSMMTGLAGIMFYASIVEHTLTYHIESPSLNTYYGYINQYPSLTCECQQLTILYEEFISFSPTYHQVCSSRYAVDDFTLHYGNRDQVFLVGTFSFRSAAGTYFSSIRILCKLVKEIVNQLIGTYLQQTYISNYLTNENEFMARMNASVTGFITLAPSTFDQLIKLMQDITQGNQLLSSSFSNAMMQYNSSSNNNDDTINILCINPTNKSCSCGMSSDSCTISYDKYCNYTFSNLLTDNCGMRVLGLSVGCYLADAILVTTFECLYDPVCISPIPDIVMETLNLSITPLPPSVYLLNKNIPSRFAPNSTVLDALSVYLIEKWNDNITYAFYYNQCKPSTCFYTITKQFNVPTVLTTIIGLIGGFSAILKIVTPLIIKLLRRIKRIEPTIHIEIPIKESWYRRFYRTIREINFFKTIETDRSIEIQQEQLYSTRLYMILWIISIIILSINLCLAQNTTSIIVDSPSMNLTNELYSQNLNEFTYPCSKITIPLGTFTSLNFTFHQIYSSELISYEWLEGLFNFANNYSVSRGVLSSHFKLLQSFCQSSNNTLIKSIENFYSNQFIIFQNQTISSFQHNLALIIDITLGNQLISAYETNWYFIPDQNGNLPIYLKSRLYQSENCSCGTSKSLYCIDPLILNENLTVTGMFIGCLPITSLLLSSLQCFYNQTCLNQVKQTLDLETLSNVLIQ